MSYRVVQRAPSADAPLVVLYLVGPGVRGEEDAKLCAALPGCGIVATPDDVIAPSRSDIDGVRNMAGVGSLAPLVVCGFSAGCQAVRALRLIGLPMSGTVTIDGTAASLPPAAWQIDVWAKLAVEARAGRTLWVATCLQQDYVEHLPVGAFAWDRHVLEQALGVELPPGTEIHEGALHVYSMPSASVDKNAHIRQQTVTLPALLAKHVRPWLEGTVETERPIEPAPPEPPSQGGAVLPARSLGERALDVALSELAAGVAEVPPGSNAGPRVSEYLRAVGMGPAPWCAAFASWCDAQVARAGGAAMGPFGMQASVAGLWRVAVSTGHARPASVHPEAGWLAIFARTPGQDPRSGGQGHVGRVEYYGVGIDSSSIQTIDGNAGDRVARVTRPASAVLGWIAYEPVVHDDATAARLWALAGALDAGTAEGDALDAVEQRPA